MTTRPQTKEAPNGAGPWWPAPAPPRSAGLGVAAFLSAAALLLAVATLHVAFVLPAARESSRCLGEAQELRQRTLREAGQAGALLELSRKEATSTSARLIAQQEELRKLIDENAKMARELNERLRKTGGK